MLTLRPPHLGRDDCLEDSCKRFQGGFTLIELMIGLVVLAITLALAMPSYSRWIQNTHIRNAIESIQNGMQRARAEAVSRNVNVSFVMGGGGFWTVTDLSSGSIIEQRPGGEISNNVTIATLPDPVPPATVTSTITFSNLGTVVANTDGTASILQIDVDSSVLDAADSRNLRIAVGVGGIIRTCDPDPDVATTDPRHC